MATSDRQKKSIVFVHPDLGIGGAERLVIDAAVGLQSLGHKVTIFTSHCDPTHCFEEAKDGTLDVRVRGNTVFPSSIAGRLSILCAILRQVHLVFSIALFSSELKQLNPDAFFVDQLSACVPLLRLLCGNARVLFYCHFPDQLLVKEETGVRKWAKLVYRIPFDIVESWSTGCADGIAVNSKFTRSVVRQTFGALRARDLRVVYPCVDTSVVRDAKEQRLWPDKQVLLSINRFERKKDAALAIRAFAGLSEQERQKSRLVIAGGFDPRNPENATCHKDLQALADSLKLSHATFRSHDTALTDMSDEETQILFLLSIPNDLKNKLLASASLLIYTPKNEHFGIVPLEAMLASIPVLATNTGGPLETIYDGRTGWLRDPSKISAWTDVMRKPLIPSSADSLRTMGEAGKKRVLAEFSKDTMAQTLDQEIEKLVQSKARRPNVVPEWMMALLVVTVLAIIGGIGMMFLTMKMVNLDEQAHLKRLAENGSEVVSTITKTVRNAPDEL